MKLKIPFLFVGLSLAFSGAAANPWFRTEKGVSYPTSGVLNPNAGTVEVRVNPVMDLDSNIPGWPFAFSVLGADERTRTLLAIFHQPNESFDKPRFRMTGLARTERGGAYAVDNAPAPKAGETAIYALTWQVGSKLSLFCNGRLIAQSNMRAPLRKLPSLFTIHDVSPLYADRIRVSTRALAADELVADPSVPFAPIPDASLVANDLDHPSFALTPTFARADPLVEPFAPLAARLLAEGDALRIPFVCLNPGDARKLPVDVAVRALQTGRKNRPEKTFKRTLELPAKSVGSVFDLDIAKLPPGYYEVSTCGRTFRVTVTPKENAPDGALADWLGLAHTRNVDAFAKTGIRWTRLWNQSELLWHMVEPQRGKTDFRTADRVVDAYRKAGVRILATLGYPPEWASLKPQPAPGAKHSFSSTPDRWQPRSDDEWRNYVRLVGTHFADRVDAWEIWNEVDWHPPAKAASFSGTTDDYFRLLGGASEALRAVAPKGKVVVSGFGCIPISDGDRMRKDLIARGAAKLVDVWNMHAYGSLQKGPECRDEIRAVAPQMPIWQSEFMWHVVSDPFRQAYLTALIHCHYLEFGYAHFFEFGWGEYLTDFNTDSPLEPLAADMVQQAHFRCCDRFLGRIPELPASDFDLAYTFLRTDGKRLSIVGSSAGDYRIRPKTGIISACDLFGRRLRPNKDGSFDLGGSAVYLVTKTPLQLEGYACLRPAELFTNGGVEDLQGDTLDGIEKCTPLGWQIRTQRDPKGRISPTAKDMAISGMHSLKLESPSEKKDVYAFAPVKLPSAGTYRLTATFRGVSGSPRPYLSLFDQMPPHTMKRQVFDPIPPGETRTLAFNAEFSSAPAGTVAAIVGIRAPGVALIDDVSLVPVSSARGK